MCYAQLAVVLVSMGAGYIIGTQETAKKVKEAELSVLKSYAIDEQIEEEG